MPYAACGKIAQDYFEGSIEITDEQYKQGLEGMCSGLEVTIYDGFKVAAPETPEPEPIPETTIEELAANALAARDQLLTVAAIRIAPLQDAVDLGLAIEADLVNLKSWKQYRVDLNRIRQQPNFPAEINWPPVPITDQSE